MFENAKRRDLFKTSNGLKAFYWCFSPYTKKHYLSIEGAHIAIIVNDKGENAMIWNEDYKGKEDYFKINIIGKWGSNND